MIEQLEPPLIAAFAPLTARFPGLALHAGPGRDPGPGPSLRAWARDLRRSAEPEAPASPQQAAHAPLRPTADARAWLLVGAAEAPAELHAPDGRALARGDDWTAEPAPGGLLLRLRAASPAPPIATVRGAPARGLRSRGACEVRLVLIATATSGADADELARAALALALPVLAEPPALAWSSFPAAPPPGPGVRLRLAAPRLDLDRQRRRYVAAEPGHAQVTTRLTLHGELELEVATHTPEPTGRIDEVVGRLGGAAITLAGARAGS
ncbi:MAG: hypothetical protein JNL82_37540 [Myxococcales bacterium]|nr:hypothetical protein [Myxococcales bacterium]